MAEASAFSNMNFLSGLGDLFIPDAKAADISKPAGPVTLDKEGDKKSFDFWKENEGKSGYDHKIFATTLSEEDLKKNESWLRASKIMYDMEHGAGKWDREVRINAWSEETANRHLAKFGINYMVGFSFQAWETGRIGLNVKNMNDEQSVALHYMTDAYNHKEATAATFGRALLAAATDPLSIVTGAAALLLAPVSGGASLAAFGAASKIVQSATTKLVVGAAVNSAVIGAATSGADDHIHQNIEIQGKKPLGVTQEYDSLRTLQNAAIGGTMSWGIGKFGAVGGAAVGAALGAGASKFSWLLHRSHSAKGSTGIDLPEFSRPLDRIKFAATRELDPSKAGFWLGFTRWWVPVRSMRVDCTKTVRPVIEAADKRMSELGLTDGILNLHKDIISAVKGGQNYHSAILKFSTDPGNIKKIDQYEASIRELREHVEHTYLTVDGTTTTKSGSKIERTRPDNKESTLFHDLTESQKKALIDELKAREDIVIDLKKGMNSTFAKEVAQSLKWHSINDLEDSANGLSSARFMAMNAFARDKKTWPDDKSPVKVQWRRTLERSINEGISTPPFQRTLYRIKGGENPITAENTEWKVQNKITGEYAKRDESGELVHNWSAANATATAEKVDAFVSPFVDLMDRGAGHDAIRITELLLRHRQMIKGLRLSGPIAGPEGSTTPDHRALLEGYKRIKDQDGNSRYDTDKYYAEVVDVIVGKVRLDAGGRHSDSWFTSDLWGLPQAKPFTGFSSLPDWLKNLRPFGFLFPIESISTHGHLSRRTRTGDHVAAIHHGKWDDYFRYQDNNPFAATPGRTAFWGVTGSITKKFAAYFAGAHDTSFAQQNNFGMNLKTLTTTDPIKWKASDSENGWIHIPIRSITRLSTGGLVDNLDFKKPLGILSGPGYVALGATGIATLAAAADMDYIEGFGDTAADLAMGITVPRLVTNLASLGISDETEERLGFKVTDLNIPQTLKEKNNGMYALAKKDLVSEAQKTARALIHDLSFNAQTGQQDKSHPLYIDDKSPGFLRAINTIIDRKITDADEAAKVISDVKAYEKQQADIAEAARQKAEAEKAAKEAADAAAKAAKEAQDAAQQQQQQSHQPQTGTGNNNASSGSATQHNGNASQLQSQSSGASTSPKSIFQNSVGAPPPVGQSVDNLLSMPGDMLKAAYTFDGNVPREIQDAINVGSHFLSGATSLTGGLLSDLYNERIQGGRWWLGAAGGVAGALMLGAWAKDLPILRTFPSISGLFVFLLAAPLIARFAKGAMDGMARQGGDKSYAPIVTGGVQHAVYTSGQQAPAFSSVSHTGGAAVAKTLWEDPDNKHPFLSKITAVDPDGPGPEKFAVQVHSDKGETYADLNVLKDWEGQGMAPVYISKEALAGMGLKQEDFRYEAISHKDANTQEEQPFINLRFLDKAHVFQNIFIGAPEGYVPQPQ